MYATLAVTLLFAAAGCYINMLTGVGGMLGVLGFMACTIWLGFTPALPSTLRKREGLLMGAALCQGTSLGPLVNLTYTLHPGCDGEGGRDRAWLDASCCGHCHLR